MTASSTLVKHFLSQFAEIGQFHRLFARKASRASALEEGGNDYAGSAGADARLARGIEEFARHSPLTVA